MKISELKQIIQEELENIISSLNEKSVPEPYNRKSPPRRPMKNSQVEQRDKIGDKMMKDKKTVAKFKKKYGKDWESYLWASATNATFKGGE